MLKIFDAPTFGSLDQGFTEMVDRLVSYQRLWNVIFTTQAVCFPPRICESMVDMDLSKVTYKYHIGKYGNMI